ncbi:MAG: hypothetical protein H6886_00545 [Hyphomicrobiaceae bacterium]|nr:hypothetical protein [Hyphomicrobiaceae bacterium]
MSAQPKPKPEFSALDLPKPDEKTIDSYTKERGAPVLVRSASPKPKPTSKLAYLRLDIPDYLAKALRVRAAEEGCTVRYLALKALKADGWEVHDDDIGEGPRRQPTTAL